MTDARTAPTGHSFEDTIHAIEGVRRRKGIKQYALAKAVGLSATTVSSWLHFKTMPSLAYLFDTLDALGLHVIIDPAPAELDAFQALIRVRTAPEALAVLRTLAVEGHASIEGFARDSRIDRALLSRWFHGHAQPRAIAMWQIAAGLDVRISISYDPPGPLVSCARCGQPLQDANCPDVCRCR